MEWFSRKTSIAGIQFSNWMVVLSIVILILLIYTFMQEAQMPRCEQARFKTGGCAYRTGKNMQKVNY